MREPLGRRTCSRSWIVRMMRIPSPGDSKESTLDSPKPLTGWVTRLAVLANDGPLRLLRGSRISQRVKRRMFEMPAAAIHPVVQALEQEGVRPVVIGGWGVDALLGEQTRKHLDLDLAFDATDEAERKAVAALERNGFTLVRREELHEPDSTPLRLDARIVMTDEEGLLVDLHPAVPGNAASVDDLSVVGRIEGNAVRCLAVPAQLALHAGYELRDFDHEDVARLEQRFGATTNGKRAIAAR